MDLSVRSSARELMDDAALDVTVYNRCIRNLAAINRITLTHRSTIRWLDAVTKDLGAGRKITILDVAYGQGDLLRAIAGWAGGRGLRARLSGIDLNPRSALSAAAATPAAQNIDYQTGDVFTFAPDPQTDFIVSSQFTHHLADDDIVRLLQWFETHAKRGWYISDLHRHFFPYYGFRWLARLMFWHRIVRYDGTVSIARAFTRADWQKLLARAGIDAKISWHMLFRYGIARVK